MHKKTGMLKTWDENSLFHRQSLFYWNNLRNEEDGMEQRSLKAYMLI
jgi:hypothetical protein